MVAASDAQAKMGITATNAQGQLLPLSNIIGQLQDKIKGMTTGQAIATLTAMGFTSASSKLVETIQAGPAAFDAATNSTNKAGSAQAAAAIQARTLGVEFKTLKATAEDVLTEFGQFLIPIVQTLGGAFVSATKFVLDHKDVLYTLGVLVGGFLTATIGAFAINTMASLVASIVRAGTTVTSFTGNLLGMGTSSEEASAETETLAGSSAELSGVVEGLTAATEQLVAATTQLAPAVATADAGLTEEAAAATEASAAMRTLAASQETAVGAMATTGTAAEGLAGKEEALAATSTETGVAMGEGGMAGGMAAGDAAGVGLTGVLGPLGLAVGAVTLGAVKLGDMLNNNTTPAFVKASDAADAMASSTLPDVTLKMQALTQAQKDDKVAMDQGGLSGQAAKVAYDGITSSINVLKGQAQQLTVNTQILSNNFGISRVKPTPWQTASDSTSVDRSPKPTSPPLPSKFSSLASRRMRLGPN